GNDIRRLRVLQAKEEHAHPAEDVFELRAGSDFSLRAAHGPRLFRMMHTAPGCPDQAKAFSSSGTSSQSRLSSLRLVEKKSFSSKMPPNRKIDAILCGSAS